MKHQSIGPRRSMRDDNWRRGRRRRHAGEAPWARLDAEPSANAGARSACRDRQSACSCPTCPAISRQTRSIKYHRAASAAKYRSRPDNDERSAPPRGGIADPGKVRRYASRGRRRAGGDRYGADGRRRPEQPGRRNFGDHAAMVARKLLIKLRRLVNFDSIEAHFR